MYVMLAWFAHDREGAGLRFDREEAGLRLDREEAGLRFDREEAGLRFDRELAGIVPDSYRRHDFGSDDWGVTVLHPESPGAYRWPMVATEGPVTAVSLALPVGLDLSGGPVSLARRLLAGAEVHREVVPPFGLMALDERGTVAIQQD